MLLIYLRTGDDKAFREIYQRYWKKMYSIAIRKIQSTDVVEEIVQDIFLRLWERRNSLQVDCLETYLFSSIRYAAINHIKSLLVQERYVDYANLHFNQASSTTDEQLALDDLMKAVEQQLNNLPEKTRQIFRMNRFEYQSIKEISTKLKVPERTVEYHLSQAIKSLRIYLRDYLLPSIFIVLFS